MKQIQLDQIESQKEDKSSKTQSKASLNHKSGSAQKKIINKKSCNYSTLLANISDTKYVVVKTVIKKILGMKVTKDASNNNWDLMWTDNMVVPEQLAVMKPYQKINHFPGMFTLSRKNYLARNLSKMAKMFPQDYDFFPKTWILPSQLSDLRAFMQNEDLNHVVIAKPQASSQGRGIFLSKTIQDFDFGQHYVVQKYLKKPLLISGLKFDLRIYVLVAGCDPLRIYIYKEGLARFATEKYSVPKKQNLNNLFMHLTNYAINKNSEKFQFNMSSQQMDTGHKRSLTSIANYMGQSWPKIWKQIKDIIAKTLISAQPLLSHHYRSCQPQNYPNNMCFQILGFDIIIDHLLKPYLLEVNYTPSFTTDTPLDKVIKENLIKQSIILMNISLKSKNQVLNTKKKQILERTLTGKKIWYSKQQRQKIIQKFKKKRDQWENLHLGNFQKVYPQQQPINQKYQQFMKFSQECYQNITGANIRRNNKVISQQPPLIVLDNDSQKQGPKLTNTQQLQKIYKFSLKPMVFKKKQKKQQAIHRVQTNLPSTKSMCKSPLRIDDFKAVNTTKLRPNSGIKRNPPNIYNITFKQ